MPDMVLSKNVTGKATIKAFLLSFAVRDRHSEVVFCAKIAWFQKISEFSKRERRDASLVVVLSQ